MLCAQHNISPVVPKKISSQYIPYSIFHIPIFHLPIFHIPIFHIFSIKNLPFAPNFTPVMASREDTSSTRMIHDPVGLG